MGMFAYVYYSSVVRTHEVTPASVMQMVRSSLTLEEQLTLFQSLATYLGRTGLVTRESLVGMIAELASKQTLDRAIQ